MSRQPTAEDCPARDRVHELEAEQLPVPHKLLEVEVGKVAGEDREEVSEEEVEGEGGVFRVEQVE